MDLISLLFPATFSCTGNRLFALCAFHARVTYGREKIYGRVGVCLQNYRLSTDLYWLTAVKLI